MCVCVLGVGGWVRDQDPTRWGCELYLTMYCHHRNDYCIKMGSDERHFNVSLTVRNKVTKTVPTDHTSHLTRQKEMLNFI